MSVVKEDPDNFGTDARFPVWSGGALERRFYSGGTTLALLLNWGALIWPFHAGGVAEDSIPSSDLATIGRFALVLVVCVATMFLIRHSDRTVQWFTRGFACGLPFAISIILLFQGLTFVR